MGNYYAFVAGLPDLSIDDAKLVWTQARFKEELQDALSSDDLKLIKLYFMQFDNKNLLAYLKNKDSKLDEKGNLSAQDLEEVVQLMKEFERPVDKRIPSYFPTFFAAYNQEKSEDNPVVMQDYLSSLYYDYAMKTRNKFASRWFEFNLNVNNVLSAFTSRAYGMDVASSIVGDNEVSLALRSSNARDFGLTNVLDEFEQLRKIADEPDLLEKEKKIDRLRWQWLEENTFFKYFSVEKILAYLIKIEIQERWAKLNPETGEIQFRNIIGRLKSEVSVIDKYRNNK